MEWHKTCTYQVKNIWIGGKKAATTNKCFDITMALRRQLYAIKIGFCFVFCSISSGLYFVVMLFYLELFQHWFGSYCLGTRSRKRKLERLKNERWLYKTKKIGTQTNFFLLRLPVCYFCSNFIRFQQFSLLLHFTSVSCLGRNSVRMAEYSLWLSSLCKKLAKSIASIVQMHFMPW